MARQYVRKKILKSTWVIDGKVYVTTNGDKKYVFRRMVVLKFFADFRILDFQIVIANPDNNLSGTIRSTFSSAMTNINISNSYFNSNLFYNVDYFTTWVIDGKVYVTTNMSSVE
jgi:hypothetical protein